jgi:uncharacterized protein YkwD
MANQLLFGPPEIGLRIVVPDCTLEAFEAGFRFGFSFSGRKSAMKLRTYIAAVAVLALLSLAWGEDKKQPEFKLTKEEQALLDATNAARAKNKLPPLKINPILTKNARDHSANMGKHKEMVHKLDGKDPGDRADESGYDWAKINENIGWWPDTQAAPLMKAWLDSKFHRDNIMGEYEDIGIGYAVGPRPVTGEKAFWVTQVFGTLKKKQ